MIKKTTILFFAAWVGFYGYTAIQAIGAAKHVSDQLQHRMMEANA